MAEDNFARYLNMVYTKEVLDKIRPEGYYYEHFGYGTFLFSDKKK